VTEHKVEKAKEKPKQAVKKAEEEPKRAAKQGEKKTKGLFDELKERVGR
jgi:vacuolar-type H+-ATPase subunit H